MKIKSEYSDHTLYLVSGDIAKEIGEIDETQHEKQVRAYELKNGDIFTINNTFIEFCDNVFYEVKKFYGFCYILNKIVPKYQRTGVTFTSEDLNKMTGV